MQRTTADPGSISSGTLVPSDLLRACLDTLDALMEKRSLSSDADPHAHSRFDTWAGECEVVLARDEPDNETLGHLLDEAFERLEDFAPEGYRFGTHEGDGADFGFWEIT